MGSHFDIFTTAFCRGDKLLSISYVRLIAMAMIVSCHFCQFYKNELAWWLNVGVQIFFILSGLLYSRKTIISPIDWLKKNLHKILIPYISFLIISIILYSFFAPLHLSISDIVKSVFCFHQSI